MPSTQVHSVIRDLIADVQDCRKSASYLLVNPVWMWTGRTSQWGFDHFRWIDL
jgi:hypothetical protein